VVEVAPREHVCEFSFALKVLQSMSDSP
jgi:hypothetical protein